MLDGMSQYAFAMTKSNWQHRKPQQTVLQYDAMLCHTEVWELNWQILEPEMSDVRVWMRIAYGAYACKVPKVPLLKINQRNGNYIGLAIRNAVYLINGQLAWNVRYDIVFNDCDSVEVLAALISVLFSLV